MRWTKVETLNKLLLQWLFLRLVVARDMSTNKVAAWAILVGPVPCTGWSGHYRTPFGSRRTRFVSFGAEVPW